MVKANIKSRIAAGVIDIAVVALLQVMLTGYYTQGNALWTAIAMVAVGWLYFTVFESSSTQGTVGKATFGIRVTDLDGSQLNFATSTKRYWLKVLTILPFGFGFWSAGKDASGQALYDRLVGTMVIRPKRA